MPNRREIVAYATALAGACAARGMYAAATPATRLQVTEPMAPPEWALLQRELLVQESEACAAFCERYFDTRGYFQCVARWGANDGPDDAIENCNEWPLLHALGGADRVMQLYTRAWEGHLRQFTEARTRDLALARGGMYYREFPVMGDWQHISEFLTVFNVMGLSDPRDPRFRERARRYASFYMGTDAEADNYDSRLRLIRSLLNGPRGPMLRQATALEWAGDPFDPTGFFMEHGERTYAEVLAHYRDYGDVVGDNPLNLQSTSVALNAYMLDGERSYRDWIESYVEAWMQRTQKNGGILPSHVDLQGRTGGKAGAWYSGVYGWGFSPVVPQTGLREDRNRVPRAVVAFMNAYLMSGNDRYLQVWRTQNEAINAQSRTVDGVQHAPTMYGRRSDGSVGWYSYKPGPYRANALEIWYLSMREDDLARAEADHPWINYLRGRNPAYPVESMRAALETVRQRMDHLLNHDKTTPENRLADALLNYNPALVTPLIHLMCGGIRIARPPWSRSSPNQGGAPLYARLRYFDPVQRRAGIPPDTAALVSELGDATTTVTLVNLNPLRAREILVQAGAYGEHQLQTVTVEGVTHAVDANHLTIGLAAGAGATLTFTLRRHVNTPSLRSPWDT